MVAKYATDLTFYTDSKKEYYVIGLTDTNVLYVYSSVTGSMKEIDYNVMKFYAGEESRIGGNGYGVWYLTEANTLHHLSGFNWDLDKIPHYRYGDYIDLWEISSGVVVMLSTDKNLYTLGWPNSVKSLELSVPSEGIKGIATAIHQVDATEDDGPIIPNREYFVVDSSGRLIE